MSLQQTDGLVNENCEHYPYDHPALPLHEVPREVVNAYWTAFRDAVKESTMMGDLLCSEAYKAQRAVEDAYWGTPTGPVEPATMITITKSPTFWDLFERGAVTNDDDFERLQKAGLIREETRVVEIPAGPGGVLPDELTLAAARGRRDALDVVADAWEAQTVADVPDEVGAASLERWARDVLAGDVDAEPTVPSRYLNTTVRVVSEPTHEPPPAESKADDGDPGPLPDRLLRVPGFVDELVRFNLATCHRVQPQLAVAGALALQAVLIARKKRVDCGLRSNVQFICVADSGEGKNYARELNMAILQLAQLEKLLAPEEFASDSGIFSLLREHAARLWHADEFGRYLRMTGSNSKATHLTQIPSALMRLYTGAKGPFLPKAYVDAKANVSVNQPCLVTYATTTPDALYGALSEDNLRDGFLGRTLMIQGLDDAADNDVPEQPIPKSILESVKWWGEYRPGDGNLDDQNPVPAIVCRTPEAKAVFKSFLKEGRMLKKLHGRGASLWTRIEEKAKQLALVYACSANRENPVIDAAAAVWACNFVRHVTRSMVYVCSNWISTNEQESRQQRLLRIIRAAHDGRIAQKDLTRQTQWLKARERLEILAGMVEAGLIREATAKTATKAGIIWESMP